MLSQPVRLLNVTTAQAATMTIDNPNVIRDSEIEFRPPSLEDGKYMWSLARDTGVLDLNSSYSYLLWCRDYAATSVVATVDREPGGFVTGYMRPGAPDTLMIWQVGVDAKHRGQKIAARMLDELAERTTASTLETTITADNEASIALFTRFAQRREAELYRRPLFEPRDYPDGHDTEYLYRIGPLQD